MQEDRGSGGGRGRKREKVKRGGGQGGKVSGGGKAAQAKTVKGSSDFRSGDKGGQGRGGGGREGSREKLGRGGGRGGHVKKFAPRGEHTKSGSASRPGDLKRKWSAPSDGAGRGKATEQGGRRGGGHGRGGRIETKGKENSEMGDVSLPANKKRRLKLERQQHRPEFETVVRSKEIWNKLRERKVCEHGTRILFGFHCLFPRTGLLILQLIRL